MPEPSEIDKLQAALLTRNIWQTITDHTMVVASPARVAEVMQINQAAIAQMIADVRTGAA